MHAQAYRDQIKRNVTSTAMLGLLTRAEGLHLLHPDDQQAKEFKAVRLGEEGHDVASCISDGYSIDSINTLTDGTAEAALSKVVGLNYPVAGYASGLYFVPPQPRQDLARNNYK